MGDNSKQLPKMLEALGKLVNAGKLVAAYTEYSFPAEFGEALDHACSSYKDTKILLRFGEGCSKEATWRCVQA